MIFGMVDFKRQSVITAAAQHGNFVRNYLNIAGRQIGVLIGTFSDNTLYTERRM